MNWALRLWAPELVEGKAGHSNGHKGTRFVVDEQQFSIFQVLNLVYDNK